MPAHNHNLLQGLSQTPGPCMMTTHGLNSAIEASCSTLRFLMRVWATEILISTYHCVHQTYSLIYKSRWPRCQWRDRLTRANHPISKPRYPGIEALAGNPLRHLLEPRRHDVTHHDFIRTSTLISAQTFAAVESHTMAQLLQAPSLYNTVHRFFYNQL